MVDMTLNVLQSPNKGQGHSSRYQSISYIRLGWLGGTGTTGSASDQRSEGCGFEAS